MRWMDDLERRKALSKFVSRLEREKQFLELTERVNYSNENKFFVIFS